MAIRINGDNPAFGNVFDVEIKDKYVKAKLSTSRRDQNDAYVNSSWFVKFVGKSVTDAKNLEDRDRIKVTSGYVSNETYMPAGGDKPKSFASMTIFEFELYTHSDTSSNKPKPKPKKRSEPDEQEIDEDDTPL